MKKSVKPLQNTKQNATNVSLQDAKRKRLKAEEFNVGDVTVPKNERCDTDMLRISGQATKVFAKSGYHKVDTEFGSLKTKVYTGSELRCLQSTFTLRVQPQDKLQQQFF